jgi:hypothetical protein
VVGGWCAEKKRAHLVAPLDDNRCESAKMGRTEAGEHHFALTLVRVACKPEEGQSSDSLNSKTRRGDGTTGNRADRQGGKDAPSAMISPGPERSPIAEAFSMGLT